MEVLQDNSIAFKSSNEAKEALQEATEEYVVEIFKKTQKCANHAKRETIKPEDLALAANI